MLTNAEFLNYSVAGNKNSSSFSSSSSSEDEEGKESNLRIGENPGETKTIHYLSQNNSQQSQQLTKIVKKNSTGKVKFSPDYSPSSSSKKNAQKKYLEFKKPKSSILKARAPYKTIKKGKWTSCCYFKGPPNALRLCRLGGSESKVYYCDSCNYKTAYAARINIHQKEVKGHSKVERFLCKHYADWKKHQEDLRQKDFIEKKAQENKPN